MPVDLPSLQQGCRETTDRICEARQTAARVVLRQVKLGALFQVAQEVRLQLFGLLRIVDDGVDLVVYAVAAHDSWRLRILGQILTGNGFTLLVLCGGRLRVGPDV